MLDKTVLERILRQTNMERHDQAYPFFIVSTDLGIKTWACRVDYKKEEHAMYVTEIINRSTTYKDSEGNICGETVENTVKSMQCAAMVSCLPMIEMLAMLNNPQHSLRGYVQRYRKNYFEWQVSLDCQLEEDTELVIIYN